MGSTPGRFSAAQRKPAVLVTSGEARASLATVRALGRSGYIVHVCSSATPSLAGFSRYASTEHGVPDPRADPAGFAAAAARLVERHGIGVLLPMTDDAVLAVLRRRAFFGGVGIPFPDAASYERLSNKDEVSRVAEGLGIDTPESHRIADPESWDLAELAALDFPVVVKPVRSVAPGPEGRLEKHSVRYASSPEELRATFAGLRRSAFPVLVQRKVAGQGFGVFLLVWDGALLGAFGHRRIREKPPAGGVSVLRESVPVPPDLLAKSVRLLEAFGWRGVAMVEFKSGSLSAKPVLMEVNARFWGSLQLAIDAGVDFPRLLVQAVLGEPVQPVLAYRYGVRSRWFWGDVDHLWARLRHSREALHLPPDSPGRAGAVLDFLRGFSPGNRGEVFRWSDPRPGLLESVRWLRGR